MSIRYACSRCNRDLESDRSEAGKASHCPACKEPLVVPIPALRWPWIACLVAALAFTALGFLFGALSGMPGHRGFFGGTGEAFTHFAEAFFVLTLVAAFVCRTRFPKRAK